VWGGHSRPPPLILIPEELVIGPTTGEHDALLPAIVAQRIVHEGSVVVRIRHLGELIQDHLLAGPIRCLITLSNGCC